MVIFAENDLLVIGKVASPYGVRGWMHIYSFTDPITNILEYQPWLIGQENRWQEYTLEAGKTHGKGIVVKLPAVDDRDQALKFRGLLIATHKEKLPLLNDDEYYWVELVGLKVVTLENIELGKVDHILETGANDVLVIKGLKEYLIPYVKEEFIKEIDIKKGVIIVDWDPDF